jgi:CubicO group peptidase (beta-lactamase class C family)
MFQTTKHQKTKVRTPVFSRWGVVSCILLITFLVSGFAQSNAAAEVENNQPEIAQAVDTAGFEAYLENIRQVLKFPAMSAAVVQDQQLIWAAGFGYADLENQVVATPDTPYALASVTKPIAAVLLMQLVEEGLIDLDTPIKQYGIDLGNDAITVRHLLTHTSEGTLGTQHVYNGSRYGYLAGVIEGATGRSFAQLLAERMLLPLEMENTALNPVDRSAGIDRTGIRDFIRMLGWQTEFQSEMDVFQRMAKPYQLDEDYNIIPGMYQLYHNAGAGLISSVTDLAKFDIALDQGLLLGGSAMAEMFTPAYSTYNNRQDLMYGLGWYVQEFEGMRLLWHTGRWPPSTSALYLKVPDYDLTFIVLANTHNLTTPFPLGDGDVTKSILALSFLRYFIYPEQHGSMPPSIDWEADDVELMGQLSDVTDEAARTFLERELWSFRQVYASVGRFDLVERLQRVDYRVYPQSSFRLDRLFTQTAAQEPVIPTGVSASTLIWVSRAMALWLALVALSLLWMVLRILRDKKLTRWVKFLWVIASLFLGPLAILIQARITRPMKSEQVSPWKVAWGASALVSAGYAAGWAIAISLLISSGDSPHPLLTLGLSYFMPYLVGLFFVRIPLGSGGVPGGVRRSLARSLLVEAFTLNLGFACFFPLTMLVTERLLTTMPGPSNPLFWATISWVAVCGVIVLLPLHTWMSRRGYRLPSGLAGKHAGDNPLPARGTSWLVFGITFVLAVAALAVTIGQI